MKTKKKTVLWITGVGLALATLAGIAWIRRFQHYTPIEVTQDVRAAIAAKNSPRRVERFLELRYGPLTEPANRQRAFLDFFNSGHIEGLRLIMQHTPEHMKQGNIDGMAAWIAEYRRTMTPDEKRGLGSYLGSAAGREKLRQATAQYLRQDIHYRASTAPVIAELMATVSAVQRE